MKKRLILTLSILLAAALLTGCIPELAKGFDKEVLIEKGKEVVYLMDAHDYEGIWALGRDDFKEMVPPEFLEEALEETLDSLGPLISIGDTGAYGSTHEETQESLAIVQLKCAFVGGTINVLVTLDVDLKLAAITLQD